VLHQKSDARSRSPLLKVADTSSQSYSKNFKNLRDQTKTSKNASNDFSHQIYHSDKYKISGHKRSITPDNLKQMHIHSFGIDKRVSDPSSVASVLMQGKKNLKNIGKSVTPSKKEKMRAIEKSLGFLRDDTQSVSQTSQVNILAPNSVLDRSRQNVPIS
jgi:hypothetical protein